MKTDVIEIQEHGVMFVDYFGGTNGVMLPVTVDNKTTLKEVIDSLEYEVNMVGEHIEYTAGYNNFEGNIWEAIYEKIKEMRMYISGREDELYNPSLDFSFKEDEYMDDEYPVAIFTIEFRQ